MPQMREGVTGCLLRVLLTSPEGKEYVGRGWEGGGAGGGGDMLLLSMQEGLLSELRVGGGGGGGGVGSE